MSDVPTTSDHLHCELLHIFFVKESDLLTKEPIQGHPLDPKETMELFTTKDIGNYHGQVDTR
jgi:hypothetical protein